MVLIGNRSRHVRSRAMAKKRCLHSRLENSVHAGSIPEACRKCVVAYLTGQQPTCIVRLLCSLELCSRVARAKICANSLLMILLNLVRSVRLPVPILGTLVTV